MSLHWKRCGKWVIALILKLKDLNKELLALRNSEVNYNLFKFGDRRIEWVFSLRLLTLQTAVKGLRKEIQRNRLFVVRAIIFIISLHGEIIKV